MNRFPTTRELADEAMAALDAAPMTPKEHFDFLVQNGIIDEFGRVLVCKLFGDDLQDEIDTPLPSRK